MKILCITQHEPNTSAMPGPQRFFNLMRQLSKSHTLDLFITNPLDTEALEESNKNPTKSIYGTTFRKFHLPPNIETSGSGSRISSFINRQLHRILIKPHFHLRHKDPAQFDVLRSSIQTLVSEYDAVYINGITSTQYLPQKISIPVIVDFCDCISSIYFRQAGRTSSTIEKLKLLFEAYAIKKEEKRVANLAQFSFAVSDEDRDLLSYISGVKEIKTLGLGIDLDYFNSKFNAENTSHTSLTNPRAVVFMGVMNYAPNEDAAFFLINEIIPEITSAKVPFIFQIVGSNPSPLLIQAAKDATRSTGLGITVTGEVPDVRPFLQERNIFVCPLRLGAGVKQKLLTAIAMRTPIIATTKSLEGTGLQNRVHCLTADTPLEFKEMILEVMDNPDLRGELTSKAYEYLLQNHSWETIGNSLSNAIIALKQDSSP